MRLAAFVSPHGFGHAARTAAILHYLSLSQTELSVDLFTLVPEWFFRSSLSERVNLTYHELETDVGFVQKTSIEEDLEATVRRLAGLYPIAEERLDRIADLLVQRRIDLVICDISVMGILAAERAGLPSILIDNFTWDWIYAPYVCREPGFQQFITYLAPLYERATKRIQTTPICSKVSGAVVVGPVARAARSTREDTRGKLELPQDAAVVLMSMGGVPGRFPFIQALGQLAGLCFVIAGLESVSALPPNVRAVPHQSSFFHPDLVQAADAIVGKVGYSTVAEAYQGRTQFLYVPRPIFPESAVMERFVREELHGVEIPTDLYESGEWLGELPKILRPVTSVALMKNGAEAAADAVTQLVSPA